MMRVPGFGSLNAKVVCIGETPGAEEEKEGRPFAAKGKSGEELTERWLRSAGIDPETVRYENVGEYRPVDNDFNRLPGLDAIHPTEPLVDSVLLETGALGWLPNLHERLARLPNLRCIISVGIWPARLLLNRLDLSSTKHRGSVFECQLPDGRVIPVIPVIHPSYLFRNQLWALRFFGLNDCVKARRIANGLDWKETLPRFEYAKDFEDAERLLKFLLLWCRAHPDSPLAFDTETLGHQVDTISFGVEDPIWKDRIYGTAVGFETFEGPRFTFDQELYLWNLVQELLWLPNPKVGHNLQYDLRLLTDMGIGVNNIWWDTLYAAHTLNPAVSQDKVGPIKPRGLDVLSSFYTYVPYYKDERVPFGGIPVEDRWLYAAKDGAVTLMVQRGQEVDLARSPGLQNVFHKVSMPQLVPFHRMEVEGVPVNKEVLNERKKVLEAEIGPLQERLTLLRFGQGSIEDWSRSLGDARDSLQSLRESVEGGSLLATCPSCDGQGGVVRCRGRKTPQLKYETCRKCKGVGEIKDPKGKSKVREAERGVRRLEKGKPEVNAKSPTQLIEWLFKPKAEGGLGLKGRKKRGAKTDNPSTGEDELRLLLLRLRPNQSRERDILDTIIAIRERQTELSNFVDLNLSPDGRFRTQNQPLEDTGRCHSRPDAYGFGRNLQNFPRKGAAKRSLQAPSGYCIPKFDYKQIEAVIVAWDAGDADFIEAVQGGVRDVHTEAAIVAFGRRPEEFSPKEWKEKWRYAGKRVRHGRNYLMGATTMWEQLLTDVPGFEITIKDCQRALEAIDELSPLLPLRRQAIMEAVRRTRSIVAPDGGCMKFYSPWDDHIGKAALAYRPQRWAATFMNSGLVEFHHYWWERDRRVQLIAQVHDSAAWLCPEDLADETVRVATEIWGAPFKSFYPEEDREKGPIVIPMEFSVGPNLNDQKGVEAWNKVNWRERQLKG